MGRKLKRRTSTTNCDSIQKQQERGVELRGAFQAASNFPQHGRNRESGDLRKGEGVLDTSPMLGKNRGRGVEILIRLGSFTTKRNAKGLQGCFLTKKKKPGKKYVKVTNLRSHLCKIGGRGRKGRFFLESWRRQVCTWGDR